MRPDEIENGMLVDITDVDEESEPGPLHALKGKVVKISKGIALVRVGRKIEERSSEVGDGLVTAPVRCLARLGVAPTEFYS